MEFHVIELPKLPSELKQDCGALELWAKFINSEQKEEFDMLAEKNVYIESAYKKLQVISQDKEKRMEYEAREKAVRDYNQTIYEAEQRGEARGEVRGEARGEHKKAIEIARNMLADSLPPDTVSKLTGLSADEVMELSGK